MKRLSLGFLLAVSGVAAAVDLPAQEGQHFRWKSLAPAPSSRIGFTRLEASATRLLFTNELAQDRHLTNQIYLNGSGVACGDVDGDGQCDVFFCGIDRGNRLFRNLGNWTFSDITAPAGVRGEGLDSTGAALADVDGDSDLDLVVNSVGKGTHVFRNDGKAQFRRVTPDAGLNPGRGGMSLALADADGDGDLDLYIANYRTVTLRDQPNTRFSFRLVNEQPVVTSIDGRPLTEPDLTNRFMFSISREGGSGAFRPEEHGEPDLLLRNDGRGNFSPVSWTDGTFADEDGRPLSEPPFDWGLAVMWRDLDGDRAPDIYVCNDFKSPDRIWRNDGRGRFRAWLRLGLRQTCISSMGVDVADIDRDGFDDLFVVDMLSHDRARRLMQRIDLRPDEAPLGAIDYRLQSPRNTLQLARGDGTYAEIAQFAGVEATEWSWTPIFLDVDLDGFEDLLISNGFERDGMNVDVLRRLEMTKKQTKLSTLEQLHLRKIFPRLATANVALRNLGRLKFEDASAAWGFGDTGVSQGMALADLDNDGDLDVVVNNLNGVAFAYRNDTAAPRLAVRLNGLSPNTRGVGAKIKVTGGPVGQTQEMLAGGRYLSSDDPIRVFAAGDGPLRVEVTWRSGRVSRVEGAQKNRLYEIDETGAVADPEAAPAQVAALFADVSERLGHVHVDDSFDDFAVQPLLPRRLSQLGPGVSWADLDGDGADELIVASGRGGRLSVFRNDTQGGFKRWAEAPFSQPVTRDQTTVLAVPRADGTVLLAGSANYEDGLSVGGCVREYSLATRTVKDLLPGHESSTGPLALADLDGDGRLDLFVGGRSLPGRYGEAASSQVFRGAPGGTFVADSENTKRLARLGLVSGAVWSDLDGDGFPDLVLACDWGPLRIFRNERGRLSEWNAPVSISNRLSNLGELTGWWNAVATGDVDGDGRLDLIASNWGRNTRYERYRAAPLRLCIGDLAGNGVTHQVEGFFDPASRRLFPLQPLHQIVAAVPPVQERMPTCAAYAGASLPEIYGDAWRGVRELQAAWLESTVFLNRGDRFEARVLPVEAQLAPAFGLVVADFDGDGASDVFLSQNFFGTALEVSRYDAGRGLLLHGDGTGDFVALPGQRSGIVIYGEQRGAAAGDFDGDGRVDLAVAQNAAATKLLRNTTGKPGLRVRLIGPAENPSGIGALLRLIQHGRPGPACEIQAGGGYWSQDSAVRVLAVAEGARQIFVRWPGGKQTTADVPGEAREISVDATGQVKKLR